MGTSTSHRAIEHIRSVAPSRLPIVLALEIATGRTAATPKNLQTLILTMAGENPSWGEGRIADELSLKLGLLVDARTVGKYLKQASRPRPPRNQRWATFVQNHATEIIACDFFTSVTATFQVLHVFIAIEIGSRRILHVNVTDHPTAEWTRTAVSRVRGRPVRSSLCSPRP